MVKKILAIGIYAVVVLFTILNHEPWRDEAQVWLLARDLDLFSLFRELPYNGHPALWYLLVFPLPKLGLPYMSMGILHGMLAITAAWIFLTRAPFPFWYRLMFIFSYFMVYEYSVVARNYIISVILLFLLADLYRHKHSKPMLFGLLVALLCHTNTHSFFAAAAFGLLFLLSFIKNRHSIHQVNQQYISLGTMLAGAILAWLSLRVQADGWRPWLENPVSWREPLEAIGNAFVPLCLTNPGMTLYFKPTWLNALFVIFFVVAIISIRKSKAAVMLIGIATAGLLYILVFRYSGYLRHYGLILIFLMTAFWIYWEKIKYATGHEPGKPRHTLFSAFVFPVTAVFLLISAGLGAKYIYKDIRFPFSGAKEMANYIRENKLQNKIIAAYNIYTITAIYPYLPGVSWWDPGLEKESTFIHWDKDYSRSRQLTEADFLQRIQQHSMGQKDYYILLGKPLSAPETAGLTLTHAVNGPEITGDEKYYLYQKRP